MDKEQLQQEEVVEQEEVTENEEVHEDKETKTYSQEEVDKMLQSETDRRITSAQKKWEAEFKEKLEKERSEAEKLASMSAEERARAEFEKEKKAWEEEKTEFEKEKMKLEATKLLSSEGLPISFVDYVVDSTADKVNENIKVFKDAWKKALDEEVTSRMKGKSPASTGLQNKDIVNMTKEEYGKLPYKERARMLSIDPDIVSKLKD